MKQKYRVAFTVTCFVGGFTQRKDVMHYLDFKLEHNIFITKDIIDGWKNTIKLSLFEIKNVEKVEVIGWSPFYE